MEEYIEFWEKAYIEMSRSEVMHIPISRNIADLGTRGLAEAKDVEEGSEWQVGPAFNKEPIEKWPINTETTTKVPESELLPKFRDGQVSVNMVLRTRGREHPITQTLLSAMDYSNSRAWRK